MTNADEPVDSNGHAKVQCLSCKARGRNKYFHRLDVHLCSKHKMNVAEYNTQYPGAPTISEKAARTAIAPPKGSKVKENIVQAEPEPEPEVDDPTQPFKFKSGVRLQRRMDISAHDKPFIPEYDQDWELGPVEMEKWEAMAAAIEAGENVLDVGPTGCGKTGGIYQLGAVLDQPVRRVQMTGELRVADFLGTKVVEVDPDTKQAITRWQDGVLPLAMEAGHWLVLDELDSAPPAILFILHSVLEPNGKLVLTGDGGRIVKRHKDFRVFATANTLGRGDETGLYTGTQVLNEAFLDRFGVVIKSEYPDKETESKILVSKTGVESKLADRMVDVARRVREALQQEQCYCTFSTRRLLAWASKAVKMKNAALAARYTVLNKLGPDDAKFVEDLVKRIVGNG